MSFDHANVKIPPPLLYAAGFILGLLLDQVLPVLELPKAPRYGIALSLLVASAILMAASMGLFRRARTSILPVKPVTTLVVAGPYRFTRNPMYVGVAGLYLGLALWFDVFWALVVLPAVIATVRLYVIPREERYLERKFGPEYLAYKARVRRWI